MGLFVLLCEGTGAGWLQLLGEARHEWKLVGRHVRARKYLAIRRMRRAVAPSATMALAWQAFIVVVLIAILSPATGLSPFAQGAAVDTLTSVGVVIAMVDVLVMGMAALRLQWARTAGRGFKTLFAALITALAFAAARRLVFDLTGEDPMKFPGALAVIGFFCLPFAWAVVIGVVATLMVLPAMAWTLTRDTDDHHGQFVARCAQGVRLVLIACAVAATCSAVTLPDLSRPSWLRNTGLAIVVGLDFWNQPACGADRRPSARVSDNRYLVVVDKPGAPSLEPMPCPSH
ncbi:hypothetical protein [Luteibacter aegosomatissinici]|uniref:hypothetical protein n=1 Tax=Luteibacter aegosomatissinici TaxID=2911539 RepID=UPI001FFBE29E|nr:hypothetical protein [Luteibacter aegosomatissinici]UPG92820.1 hypothetical protein L2Y97_13190 [Luteibacter aegosomatissinici]